MGGLGPDDSGHITLPGLYDHTLRQHHMFPPSAERAEFDEAFIGDEFHNKPDLVHMACKHDSGGLCFPIFPADDASQPVLLNGGEVLEVSPNNLPDSPLITGHTRS